MFNSSKELVFKQKKIDTSADTVWLNLLQQVNHFKMI